MNIHLIIYMLGQILRVEGLFMAIPLLTSVICRESSFWTILVPMLVLILLGTALTWKSPANKDKMSARDGLFIVGLSWILMSLFGMVPFLLSGAIPNPIDAFFETVSGFTTTGATVLSEAIGTLPEDLDKGIAMWRSLTHWIGGMGVLVFVLAVMPQQEFKSARLMHAMRAEVPGPVATKVVATIRRSAAIMYAIYIALTVLEFVLLLFGGMSVYDAVLHSLSTAGTGGFSSMNASIAAFPSPYVQWVITVFMLLFSVNFNLYYLLLVGHAAQALLSEELRWFALEIVASAGLIVWNIASLPMYNGKFSEALRDASFAVASFASTTGFTTVNYELWPAFSQMILVLLMFLGGCTGATCGGLKLGRIMLLVKGSLREMTAAFRPREVRTVRIEGKTVDEETVRGACSYFALYMLLFGISMFGVSALSDADVLTSFTAVASCINNVGPGLGKIGMNAGGNFGSFTGLSKILLSIDMLLGRLEIFPILVLFMPRAWKKR